MSAVWFLCFVVCVWTGYALFFMLVQKPLFFFSNDSGSTSRFKVLALIERHGCRSDFIIASYLTLIPVLITLYGSIFPGEWFRIVMTAYFGLISVVLGMLVTADYKLYPFWGFKIDASVLPYLRSLKGATASVSTGYIVLWVVMWLLTSVLIFLFSAGVSLPLLLMVGDGNGPAGTVLSIILTVLFFGVAVLIIRGLGPLPNNPSIAYFSSNQFYNHAALNPVYSLLYSISKRDVYASGFEFMPREESKRISAEIFSPKGEKSEKLLTTDRPNILLIIWESANASLSETICGNESVIPNFDRLASEGILFRRCVASSFRTERAIPAILSAVPGQPTDSIIRHTRKLSGLPGLPKSLALHGYETSAIHGGDLSIVHKNDFYMSAGSRRLVGQKNLPSDLAKGKWGIHDGPVLNWVFDDIMRLTSKGEKWFSVVQTLSSHEPFVVPEEVLPGDNDVKNSFAYTDRHLGKLIDRLKNSPAWKDLLVVIVGDHGVNRVAEKMSHFNHAHVPLLMLGGAVKAPRIIEETVSQTDLAATILSQLGIDHSDFPFSRDIFSGEYKDAPAYHAFSNGLMIVDNEGHTTYDLVSQSVIEGDPSPERIKKAQAIVQTLYDYIDSLG